MKLNLVRNFCVGGSFLGIFLLLLFPGSPPQPLIKLARESLPKTVMISVITVIEKTTVSVSNKGTTIETSTAAVQFLGSGVFISPNGHVLTCGHLFTEGRVTSVTIKAYDEWEYPGEVLVIDKDRDLALVQINEKTPHYARLADPRSLVVGQEVLAIGNPLGLEFSVTHGILSALNRDGYNRYNATQSDTFINPGNSGGPLFDITGQLIGINSFLVPPIDAPIFTGCGFSVQPGQIVEFLVKYRAKAEGLPKFRLEDWK